MVNALRSEGCVVNVGSLVGWEWEKMGPQLGP